MKLLSVILLCMMLLVSHSVHALVFDSETGEYVLNSSDSEESETEKTMTYDGPLEDLHKQLEDHEEAVRNQLDEKLQTLEEEGDTLLSDGPESRATVLRCLELVEGDFDLAGDIKTTYQELKTQSEIVATDLHSEINALETKMEQGLLSELSQNITLASLQNKVDAYGVEYTNVVDMFYELSIEKVTDLEEELETSQSENADILKKYDARVETYKTLEESYADFLEKASFSSVLAGPNIQELLTLVDGIETYSRSLLVAERQKNITAHIPLRLQQDTIVKNTQTQALSQFSRDFSTEAQALLGDIYPVEQLQSINKSIVTLRSAYLKNGVYDCKSFANNPTMDISAPQLTSSMTTLLQTLNDAAQKIKTDEGRLPVTLEELKDGVLQDLSHNAETLVDERIALETQTMQTLFDEVGYTRLSIPLQTSVGQVEVLVRTYLQKHYQDALSDGEYSQFTDLIARAEEKIQTKLSDTDVSGGTEAILLVVQRVVQEFN